MPEIDPCKSAERIIEHSAKAGIKIIGVSWGLGGVEGFEAAPPDVLVHTPQELAQVLLAD